MSGRSQDFNESRAPPQRRYTEQGYEDYGKVSRRSDADVDDAIARMGNMRIKDDGQMRSNSAPISPKLRTPTVNPHRSTSPRPRPNQEQVPLPTQYSHQQYSQHQEQFPPSQYQQYQEQTPLQYSQYQERPSQYSQYQEPQYQEQQYQEQVHPPSQYPQYQERVLPHSYHPQSPPPSQYSQYSKHPQQQEPTQHPQHQGSKSPPPQHPQQRQQRESQNSQYSQHSQHSQHLQQQESTPSENSPQQKSTLPPSQHPQHPQHQQHQKSMRPSSQESMPPCQESMPPLSQHPQRQESMPPPSQHPQHLQRQESIPPSPQHPQRQESMSPSLQHPRRQESMSPSLQHPQRQESMSPSLQHPQRQESMSPSLQHPRRQESMSPSLQHPQRQESMPPSSQHPQRQESLPPSRQESIPPPLQQQYLQNQEEGQNFDLQDGGYYNYPPQGEINVDQRQQPHYYNQYDAQGYYVPGQQQQNFDPAIGYPDDAYGYPPQQYDYDQGPQGPYDQGLYEGPQGPYDQGLYDQEPYQGPYDQGPQGPQGPYDQQGGYGYNQYPQEYPPSEGYYGGEIQPQEYYHEQPQQYYDSYPPEGGYPQDEYGVQMYYGQQQQQPPPPSQQQQMGQPQRVYSNSGNTQSNKTSSSKGSKHSFTLEEIDKYRQKAKAGGDPASLLAFGKYLIDAAAFADENEPDPKNAKRKRDMLLQEAIKLIKRLATQGMGFGKPAYPEAQFYLANCYGSGALGLPQDKDKAFSLYMQASKQNHPAATYRTAVCYEVAAGTKRDPQRSTQFYRKAAALGDTAAMYKLGMIMLTGPLSQNSNPREAIIWLKRAAANADEENPHALHELGLLHAKPEKEPPEIPSLIRSEKHAIEDFKRAADLGYAPSCFKLGCCYEYGQLGCPVDPRQSIKYYSKAAEKGDCNAELALSGWYLTGSEGILKQSDTEAYLWACKAADKGLAKAEYAIGYYAEVGIGVKQDIDEARRWYMRAAAQGNKRAMLRLTELKKLGSASRVKPTKHTRNQANKEDCVIS